MRGTANNFGLVLSGVKAGRLSVAAEAPRMLAFVAELSEPAALAEAKAQASAIEEYLAHRRDGTVEEYNAAVKIRARVEHRLGEVLAATVNHAGSRGVGVTVTPTIPECLGDTPDQRKNTSKRAQQLAAVPWQEIETVIDTKTAKSQKASLKRVVREVRNGHGADATARVERTAYDNVNELCAEVRRRLKGARERFGAWPDAVADMGPQTRWLLYRSVRDVIKCFRELERELRRAGGGTAPDRKGACDEGD